MKNRIDFILNEQITNLERLRANGYSDQILEISNIIVNSIKNGGKVLIAGNGGSAADAQHFAAELVGRFVLEREGYPAIALTTDSSILTAIGNDYGFDCVFSRQVQALGKENDVFIGISTSGNSKNVILAIEEAKKHNMKVVGLIGKDGGKIKELCDISIIFNYSQTARIQEHHLMSYHIICELVEKELKEYNEK